MNAPRPDRRAAALAALALLLAGCDGSTAPDLNALRLVATAGAEQRGVPNEAAPLPLVLRVLDSEGEPVRGAGVAFRVGTGSGAVEVVVGTTGVDGNAIARWTLGAAQNQEVTATVAGSPEASFVFRASLLPREEADLIVVAGQGDNDVSLIAYDAGGFSAQDSYRTRITDSVLVLPFGNPDLRDEVAAFARGRPPVLLNPVQWTAARRDTLRVDFGPVVEIPITLWIVQGPFQQQADVARAHAKRAQEVWSQEAMGVRFSEVVVRDATGHPRAEDFQGANPIPCGTGVRDAIGKDEGRINVYYVGGVGEFAGYACSVDYVMMAELSGRYPTLLAHEIGHTFGLSHEAFGRENVMNPNPGNTLTSGQIFHAHFQRFSALNSVYRTYPAAMLRDCRVRADGSQAVGSRACMPASYDLF